MTLIKLGAAGIFSAAMATGAMATPDVGPYDPLELDAHIEQAIANATLVQGYEGPELVDGIALLSAGASAGGAVPVDRLRTDSRVSTSKGQRKLKVRWNVGVFR